MNYFIYWYNNKKKILPQKLNIVCTLYDSLIYFKHLNRSNIKNLTEV